MNTAALTRKNLRKGEGRKKRTYPHELYRMRNTIRISGGFRWRLIGSCVRTSTFSGEMYLDIESSEISIRTSILNLCGR